MDFDDSKLYVGDVIIDYDGNLDDKKAYRTLLYKMSDNFYYDLYERCYCYDVDNVIIYAEHAVTNLVPYKSCYIDKFDKFIVKKKSKKLYNNRFKRERQ